MNKWLILALTALSACSPQNDNKGLKVAASPIPHAELLEFIKPDLEAQGIPLSIIIADDYNIPNRALAQKEIDANFFQHKPFLEAQKEAFGYPLISIGPIEIEPMGLYSKKIDSLKDLADNSLIALPNDPSNETRALLLLESEGLIKLKKPLPPHATLLDVVDNPKSLRLIEIDAPMLPRTLEDVEVAAINTNFALSAGLHPEKNALAIESKDSPYANILVIREEDAGREDLQALKKALTSPKMKQHILKKYEGAIQPSW